MKKEGRKKGQGNLPKYDSGRGPTAEFSDLLMFMYTRECSKVSFNILFLQIVQFFFHYVDLCQLEKEEPDLS